MNDVFEPSTRRFARLVDSGAGRRAIHWLIFLLFAATMALLHARGTFQGLKSPRAMEEAQLARALANGEGLTTRCIRPLSLWKLSEAAPDAPLRPDAHPDLLHPPVWPTALAGILRATGHLAPHTANGLVDPGDYWPLAGAHLFAVLSVLWVWLIARRLFDARTGTLSAVSYLLCAAVWNRSAAADDFSCALFFLLGSVHFAVCAADPRRGDGTPWPDGVPVPLHRWLPALALSSAMAALAFLSRHSAGCAAELAAFLHLATARHRPHHLLQALLHALFAAIVVLPWVLRNLGVCGTPFGLAPLAALSGTYLFPGDALPRSLSPTLPDSASALYAIQLKLMANLRACTATAAGFAAAGPLPALALASCFHPFRRHASARLRWCLLAAAAVSAAAACVFAPESPDPAAAATVAALLVPLAIPYGWAFFLILLDRLRTPSRFVAGAATAALLAASSWGFLLAILPPRTGQPYPPYYHAYADWACDHLPAGGTMATDIPWATAWYGNVSSLLLPADTSDFAAIDRTFFRLPLAYITSETRDRPWHSALSSPDAPDRSWYLLMSEGRVPSDFPLQHARFIGGADQLLLSSHPLD